MLLKSSDKMFSETLDGLVLRLMCVDGCLYTCRPYVLDISETIDDLQKEYIHNHNDELINDVTVPFSKKIVSMFLEAANPMMIRSDSLKQHTDEIKSCMDWFGPKGEYKTIVMEGISD